MHCLNSSTSKESKTFTEEQSWTGQRQQTQRLVSTLNFVYLHYTKRSPFLCFNAGGTLSQCSTRSTSCRAKKISNKVVLSLQDVADLEPRACSWFLCPLISTKPPKSQSGLWRDHLFDCQKIPRMKRFHLQQSAGPVNSKWPPLIKINWSITY